VILNYCCYYYYYYCLYCFNFLLCIRQPTSKCGIRQISNAHETFTSSFIVSHDKTSQTGQSYLVKSSDMPISDINNVFRMCAGWSHSSTCRSSLRSHSINSTAHRIQMLDFSVSCGWCHIQCRINTVTSLATATYSFLLLPFYYSWLNWNFTSLKTSTHSQMMS
jgi:hypothetical protein